MKKKTPLANHHQVQVSICLFVLYLWSMSRFTEEQIILCGKS